MIENKFNYIVGIIIVLLLVIVVFLGGRVKELEGQVGYLSDQVSALSVVGGMSGDLGYTNQSDSTDYTGSALDSFDAYSELPVDVVPATDSSL